MPQESSPADGKLIQKSGNGSRKKILSATRHSADINSNDYSGVVLSSAAEVRRLGNSARQLMQTEDPMQSTEFFLASLDKGWRPRVVAVRRADNLIGILYAKERIFKGVPTGIVYADGSLGSVLHADPLHHPRAFRVAAEALLASAGILGMRMRILQSSCDFSAVLQLSDSKSFDVLYFPMEDGNSPLWKTHAHLALPETYDQFLGTLGGTTRHNFRYYRRRFEASGHNFVEHLSMDELRSAVLYLLPKSKLTARSLQKSELCLDMVEAADRPLAVGLKHRGGEWLSVLWGWYMPDGAALCCQCNNEEDYGPDSLSVVLRAYLIEFLIRQGLMRLVIWGGTGPPLSRYVSYARTVGVHMDVTGRAWRAVRSIISMLSPHLPGRLAAAAQWIL